jgi:hypothetical protein
MQKSCQTKASVAAQPLQKCKKRAKSNKLESSPTIKKPHKTELDYLKTIAQGRKVRKRLNSVSHKNLLEARELAGRGDKSKGEFWRLRNKWYNKLKAEGFNDIERHDQIEGNRHKCELINWQKRGWDRRLESTREFYARITNYLTHVPFFAQRPKDRALRIAAKLFEKGRLTLRLPRYCVSVD